MILRNLFIIALIIATNGTFSATGAASLSVTTFVVDGGRCTIEGTTPVNFPLLNPTSPVDITTSGGQSGTVAVRCTGLKKGNSAFVVSLATPTPLTLKRSNPSSADVIPYMLELPAGSLVTGPGIATVTIPVVGKLLGAAYQTAPYGDYQDIVSIQVTP